MQDLKNRRVTVLGLGRFGGGIAVARWLSEQGARVRVTDRDSAESLADSVRQLDGLAVEFRLGESQQRVEDFTDADLVVTSPAVKPHHPFLQGAQQAGVPVTTEICLFIERCPARVYGVTGTKGKSTTTAMLGRVLESSGTTFVGGNIGASLLPRLGEIDAAANVVLELSSYMLHWLGLRQWSPEVAVVTMIGLDHLEWHQSAEAYLDAKRNITRYQKRGDRLIRRDDPASRTFAAPPGVTTQLYPDPALRPFDLLLPGEHNQHNAQAAYLAASDRVSREQAATALAGFTGLPHRLELVHESNGVRFYNDSIATIPEAAVIACDAFDDGRVIQIIGGAPKEGLSWDAMAAHLAGRCKRVLTIGTMGQQLADLCVGAEYVQTLPAAVERAKDLAGPGDVVLLSPGTASYDQYPNFEKRGEHFARLARES